jgi:hypothetical protein
MLSNSALEYTIRNFQENNKGLEMNGTHQLLVCADNDKLLGESINIIKRNKEALSGTSKKAGLEVNTEKNKYTLMFHHQTTG